jgi:hypothetical protein
MAARQRCSHSYFTALATKAKKEAKGANATPEHKAEKKDAKSVDKKDKAAK